MFRVRDQLGETGEGGVESVTVICRKHWSRREELNLQPTHYECLLENEETLGNVRKHKHLAGLSAEHNTESLGVIRNRSGRQMGDILQAFRIDL